MKTYQVIARTLGALRRCEQTQETHQEWIDKHSARLEELLGEFPSGSGFDKGTKLDDASTSEKLVFDTAFHHMNENGSYDGWTDHQVIVTASLEMGLSVKVTGRDRNDIKSYISECFHQVLAADIPEYKPEPIAA